MRQKAGYFMNWTPLSLTSTALALAAALSLALPTSAASPGATATGTSEGVVRERPPGQNPCQTQLVSDLRQCENLFCPSPRSCNRSLKAMCVSGARTAFEQCMRDL